MRIWSVNTPWASLLLVGLTICSVDYFYDLLCYSSRSPALGRDVRYLSWDVRHLPWDVRRKAGMSGTWDVRHLPWDVRCKAGMSGNWSMHFSLSLVMLKNEKVYLWVIYLFICIFIRLYKYIYREIYFSSLYIISIYNYLCFKTLYIYMYVYIYIKIFNFHIYIYITICITI